MTSPHRQDQRNIAADHDHDHTGHDHHVAGHKHAHRDDHKHPTAMRALSDPLFRPHTHDADDSASAVGVRAVKISLLGLIMTAALQSLVVIIGGSIALLADTAPTP